MAKVEYTIHISNEGSRNDVRSRVISLFMQEAPGTGQGDLATHYRYYVERLADGSRIYLDRPAFLHNGFDFLVSVENTIYNPAKKRLKNSPAHEDIAQDLLMKRQANPVLYRSLYQALYSVFQCHDLPENIYQDLHFDVGLSAENILKVMKWLFIEQDIRYWNYAGRNKTWGIVPVPFEGCFTYRE